MAAEACSPVTLVDPPSSRTQWRWVLTSALLLTLAFEPYAWLPPAGEAVAPALLVLVGTAPLLAAFALDGGLGRMLGFGLLWWGATTCWLFKLDPFFGPPAWVAATLLLACDLAPLGWILARLRRRYGLNAFLWLAPVAWTGWEWLRVHPPLGTPWLALGNAFWKLPVLCQIVEISGVPGLTLVIVMVGAGLARLLLRRPGDRFQLALGCGLLLGLLAYGQARLAMLDAAAGPPVKVALVQPNIATTEKKMILRAEDIFYRVLRQTDEVPAGTDLVIWPETAAPLLVENEPALTADLAAEARRLQATLCVGTFHEVIGDGTWPNAAALAGFDNPSPSFVVPKTNAAVIFGPDGRVVDVYSKVRLVLFGEYFPGRQYPVVARQARYAPQFFAGRRLRAVHTPVGRLGVVICYESVFPSDVRALVRDGAEFLAVMTNDDQLLQTGARQHYQQAVFRCIENRRWMARCANGCISAVIDPAGRVVAASDWNRRTITSGTLHRRSGLTPLARLGDWFGLLCLLATAAALAPRRRRGEARRDEVKS
jgi:apolipoprotein N-acyltransferase